MTASSNPLHTTVSRLEREQALDAKAEILDKAAAVVASGSRESILRGDWLGHALHPLMTDLPLGCWLSAGVLDVFGGRASRKPRNVSSPPACSSPRLRLRVAWPNIVNSTSRAPDAWRSHMRAPTRSLHSCISLRGEPAGGEGTVSA